MIRAVLFDLDGTLLHSAPDLVAALNWLRAQHGLPELAVKAMQHSASRGALGLLQDGMPQADAEIVEGWRQEFLYRYQRYSFLHSRLYDGACSLLAYLHDTGMSWGIVTNKPEYLTLPILSAAGLSDSIGCVVCGDTIEERKPHPAPILLACRRLNVLAKETLFVGDDIRDLEAGRAAGVRTCAALYGYGSAELLKPENLHLVNAGISIDSLGELLARLKRCRGESHTPLVDAG